MKSRKPIQLIIPNPCQEKWEEMHLRSDGRFCDHCQKTVIDFTKFTDKDLYAFFEKHTTEKVCGRFLSTQLNREIQLPYQPHSQLYRIAVALGFVLSFSQIPEMQARWRAPLVVENSIGEMMKEDEKVEGDSLVVRGTVVDEKNEPIINAIVEISRKGKIRGGAVTDEDGLFIIKPIDIIDGDTIETRYVGYYNFSKKLSKSDASIIQEVKMQLDTNIVYEIKVITMGTMYNSRYQDEKVYKLDIQKKTPIHKSPVIIKENPSATTISGEQINKMP